MDPIRLPSNRRQWLKSISALTTLCLLLKSRGHALAWLGASDEKTGDVRGEYIHYTSASFKIDAYVARPTTEGVHPSLIVLHDEGGLNEQICEVVRGFAAAGFCAMAPDLLSRSGGTKRWKDHVAEAISHISTDATVEDLRSGYGYLRETLNPKAERVSVVGFGWGGWRSYLLAAHVSSLSRAVVYSGNAPSSGLSDIAASFLAHYGQFDFRMAGNALWMEKELGKRFTYHIYPAVDHSFYDNTSPQYNATAASLAWSRTLDFLRASR